MAANKKLTGGASASSTVTRELDQFRKKVKQLTLKLEREVKARELDARLAAETKKAREQMTREKPFGSRHGSSHRSSSRRSVMPANGTKHSKRHVPKSWNSSWNSGAKPRNSGASPQNSGSSPRNRPIEPLRSSVLTPRMPQSLLRLNRRHRTHPRSRVRRAPRPTSQQQPSRARRIPYFSIVAVESSRRSAPRLGRPGRTPITAALHAAAAVTTRAPYLCATLTTCTPPPTPQREESSFSTASPRRYAAMSTHAVYRLSISPYQPARILPQACATADRRRRSTIHH
jgi:hypothetical protein